jgi:hypothetical protein
MMAATEHEVEFSLDMDASTIAIDMSSVALPGPVDVYMVAGEIGEDGVDDILLSGFWWTEMHVLVSNAGGFEVRTVTTSNLLDPGLFDLDGDGHLDVVSASHTGLVVLPGDGTGDLGAQMTYELADTGIFIQERLLCGQTDADADPECVVTDSTYAIRLLQIDPESPGILETRIVGSTHGNELRGWWLSDFDGDGGPELLVAHEGSAVIDFPSAGEPSTIAEYAVPMRPLHDIGGDGTIEIASLGLCIHEPHP